RLPQAEEAGTTAVDLFTKLANEDPRQPVYRRELAAAHINLGIVLMATNRPQPAERAWRTAIDILRQLVAEPRSRPDDRSLLAAPPPPPPRTAACRAALTRPWATGC